MSSRATIGYHVLISPLNRNGVSYLFLSPIFSFACAVDFERVGSIAGSKVKKKNGKKEEVVDEDTPVKAGARVKENSEGF